MPTGRSSAAQTSTRQGHGHLLGRRARDAVARSRVARLTAVADQPGHLRFAREPRTRRRRDGRVAVAGSLRALVLEHVSARRGDGGRAERLPARHGGGGEPRRARETRAAAIRRRVIHRVELGAPPPGARSRATGASATLPTTHCGRTSGTRVAVPRGPDPRAAGGERPAARGVGGRPPEGRPARRVLRGARATARRLERLGRAVRLVERPRRVPAAFREPLGTRVSTAAGVAGPRLRLPRRRAGVPPSVSVGSAARGRDRPRPV